MEPQLQLTTAINTARTITTTATAATTTDFVAIILLDYIKYC